MEGNKMGNIVFVQSQVMKQMPWESQSPFFFFCDEGVTFSGTKYLAYICSPYFCRAAIFFFFFFGWFLLGGIEGKKLNMKREKKVPEKADLIKRRSKHFDR